MDGRADREGFRSEQGVFDRVFRRSQESGGVGSQGVWLQCVDIENVGWWRVDGVEICLHVV